MQLGDLLVWCSKYDYHVFENSQIIKTRDLTDVYHKPHKIVTTTYSIFKNDIFLAGNLTYDELVDQLQKLFAAQSI